MRVHTTTFHGNPNVGLSAYCAEHDGKRLCIIGEHLSKEEEKHVAEALGAELHYSLIAGTPMPGIFLAGNSKALLVPSIAFEREITVLKHLGLPVHVFESRLTCLGNNILVNEHGCLVNPDFTDSEIKKLHTLLNVPVKRIKIAGLDTPGACVVVNGRYGIIHRDAAEHEIEMVKQTLGLLSLEPASVNLGSPYVRAGVLSNSNGFVISSLSGGPEIVHIENSLGYLEERR